MRFPSGLPAAAVLALGLSGCGIWELAPGGHIIDGGGEGGTPTATLVASNVTPQANEQVTLTCRVQNATVAVTRFGFSPAARLTIDSTAGTASFIVSESDLGQTFSFTCSATLANGAQVTSPTLVLAPTGATPPP